MNDKPIAFIKEQPLTSTPATGGSTLVDDTVALVDDTVALVDDPTAFVGGPNTITENIKTSVKPSQLFTKIPRNS